MAATRDEVHRLLWLHGTTMEEWKRSRTEGIDPVQLLADVTGYGKPIARKPKAPYKP